MDKGGDGKGYVIQNVIYPVSHTFMGLVKKERKKKKAKLPQFTD